MEEEDIISLYFDQIRNILQHFDDLPTCEMYSALKDKKMVQSGGKSVVKVSL